MNHIELNAILYYADFLSLKDISKPVTDNCKYFFIHQCPINSAYILGLEPEYDKDSIYFQQAETEYTIIRDKYGDDGVASFIDDICSIKACGSVDGEMMLKCIHQYSHKRQRKTAFNIFHNWENNRKYTHIITNEQGDPIEAECTEFVFRVEKMLGKPVMAKSL